QGRPDNSETRDRVYVIRSDGTGWRQLSDSSYGAEGPRWSRDGRAISFRQVPYPQRFWADMHPPDMAGARKGEQVVEMRADGSGMRVIANHRRGDSRPSWTRDAGRAFFLSDRDGHRAVYVMNADGSGVRRLADADVVPEANVSPDGRHFAYT